ncbi:MAG: GDYXXLXY domain-containing protein [Fretibacterium sp.]|nr:GDYXXLXY domain-containing protein [Fretibacterium sp.]
MSSMKKYLLAMALPLAVLLIIPLRPALVFLLGVEVRLATEPVDPREIFRGDHVNLSFSIERLSPLLLSSDEAPEESLESLGVDGTWYVLLSKNAQGIDEPTGLSRTRPESGVYIRGRRMYGTPSQVALDYGPNLKRFYVRENTGPELERAARAGALLATVKLWRGIPVLVSLDMAGKGRILP